jgi:predicted HicB family RNase H-like nuclease
MAISMEYKGYVGLVEFDEDENMLHGRVVNTRDVVTFVGRTVKEVGLALRDSIEEYLAFCRERGREPNKPYSGKFQVRVDPTMHAKIAAAAAAKNESLNEFVKEALENAVVAEARPA